VSNAANAPMCKYFRWIANASTKTARVLSSMSRSSEAEYLTLRMDSIPVSAGHARIACEWYVKLRHGDYVVRAPQYFALSNLLRLARTLRSALPGPPSSAATRRSRTRLLGCLCECTESLDLEMNNAAPCSALSNE